MRTTACLILALSALLPTPVAARPKAAPGEPAFERTKDLDGETIWRQDLSGPPIKLNPATLSIAELYQLTGGDPAPIAAFATRLSCAISSFGAVFHGGCVVMDDIGPVRERLALRLVDRERLPEFRRLPYDHADNLYRRVIFPVTVDALTVPHIDLASGPLVEAKQMPALARAIAYQFYSEAYPNKAMARHEGGNMTAECQIQADLSFVCHMVSFAPPEAAADFAGAIERLVSTRRVDPLLTTGASAVGARAQVRVKYVYVGDDDKPARPDTPPSPLPPGAPAR